MMAVLSHSFKTQEDKMAQIKLQADEVLPTIDLVESMFPGVDLTPIRTMFAGTSIIGHLTLTKKLKN